MRIRKAKELHDAQPVYCLRSTGNFYEYLVTGYTQPWAAIDLNGSMVGYLVSNTERNRITEFFADDEAAMAAIVHAWFAQQNVRETNIILPSWAQSSAWYLDSIAEDGRVTNSGNWKILNWHRVVDALLQVKNG